MEELEKNRWRRSKGRRGIGGRHVRIGKGEEELEVRKNWRIRRDNK